VNIWKFKAKSSGIEENCLVWRRIYEYLGLRLENG